MYRTYGYTILTSDLVTSEVISNLSSKVLHNTIITEQTVFQFLLKSG